MHPDLANLIELERSDREITRLSDEISSLPKHLAVIEGKLADIKTRVQKAHDALKAQDVIKRRHESDIQDLQQKISKFKAQTLDVKTNEQYKALLHEIEFAELEIRRREDLILDGMSATEALNNDVKKINDELKAQTAENEKEKESARALTAKDEKELAEWQAKRKIQRDGTTPDSLQLYDRVVKARKTAVAEALSQKCTACHVMLRPQTWNEVKTNERFITCDSCGRIFFYDPTHEPQAPPVEEKKPKKKKAKKEVAEETAEPGADENVPVI
jgi:predicted  nucleic acid-binding Zn-ribbon protein